MYVLGIDTSTLIGGVALLKAGELVGEIVLNIRTTHSERLLPAVENLLAAAEVDLGSVGATAAVVGPGSFTGIRIGVATAKGFAYALGHPLVGVTTLEAYGWQFKSFSGIVVPLLDARRGLVYAQAFSRAESLTEPGIKPLAEVLEWCQREKTPCLFVGDGAYNYKEEIKKTVELQALPPPAFGLLRPAAAAGLGYERLLRGERGDAFSLNPIYMRQTEAERKWQEDN